MRKEEKLSPHIIATSALVVFIVLGLACASTPRFFTTDDGLGYFVNAYRNIEITGYNGTSTDVIIPESINGKLVTEIRDNAFKNKNLTSVIIPSSVTIIGSEAFKNNNLTSIIIPPSVTGIGYDAFKDNNQLTADGVEIPEHLYSRREAIFDEALYYALLLSTNPEIADEANETYELANRRRDEGNYFAAIRHYFAALSLWPIHTDAQNNLKQLWDRRIEENQRSYPAPLEGEWKYVISPATTRTEQVQVYDEGRALGLGRAYGYRTETRVFQVPEQNIVITFDGRNYSMISTDGGSFAGTFFYSNEKRYLRDGEEFRIEGYSTIIELENGMIFGFNGTRLIPYDETDIIFQRVR